MQDTIAKTRNRVLDYRIRQMPRHRELLFGQFNQLRPHERVAAGAVGGDEYGGGVEVLNPRRHRPASVDSPACEKCGFYIMRGR